MAVICEFADLSSLISASCPSWEIFDHEDRGGKAGWEKTPGKLNITLLTLQGFTE
jgi:hypothetical protein